MYNSFFKTILAISPGNEILLYKIQAYHAYFFYNDGGSEKLTETEKQEIDSRRQKFGVKPLESTQTIVNGNITTSKKLW